MHDGSGRGVRQDQDRKHVEWVAHARGTCERGLKCMAKSPGRANGMGIKIKRKTMKAVVGGERGIRVPWL